MVGLPNEIWNEILRYVGFSLQLRLVCKLFHDLLKSRFREKVPKFVSWKYARCRAYMNYEKNMKDINNYELMQESYSRFPVRSWSRIDSRWRKMLDCDEIISQ